MAKKDKSKNLPAVAEESGLPALPDGMLDDMLASEGQGLENASVEDFALPLIQLLQKLSPQVDDTDSRYIEGARAGDFLHSVSREVIPGEEGFLVIPVLYKKVYVEWIPRERGGGFVNVYDTKQEADQYSEPENDVVDTAQWYVLLEMPDGSWTQAVIPMTSTKMKVSRNWATQARMKKIEVNGEQRTPPLFSQLYRISSKGMKNDKGAFHNMSVDFVSLVDDARLYAEAKSFYAALNEGRKGVDYETSRKDEEGSASDEDLGGEI